MAETRKSCDERRRELNWIAATPNGADKLHAILMRNLIPFDRLPLGTLMIQAILDHEFPAPIPGPERNE